MNTTRTLLLSLAITAALAACSKPAEAPAATAEPAAAAAPATDAPAANDDAAPIQAVSGTYAIDPAHTMVVAQWNHLGFSNPTAHFGQVEGVIVHDADNVGASSVQVTLPLAGITSYTAKFNEHLSSADFFDVAKFPQATFKSTSVTANGGNKFTVVGDLTIKNTTKPVTLDVTLNGAGEHPMRKVPAVGFDATTTLKRSDFGLGGFAPAVSDEVKVHITTEAFVAAPEAPAG